MNKKFPSGAKLVICIILLIFTAVLALCAGSRWISPIELFEDIINGNISRDMRIVLYIRLPRLLGAVLAGSALAVAGAVIQAVLGNPLAAPNIIGVNSGAGLFTVLCAALFTS